MPRPRARREPARLQAGTAAALFLILALQPALSGHNAIVHRDMTARAYDIMLAVSAGAVDVLPGTDAAAAARFITAIKAAVSKLQALPAGLPRPKQSTCADTGLIQKIGSSSPNWAAGSFGRLALNRVRYPISIAYISGNDCGIDPEWAPGAFFDTINTGGISSRDHTGVTLGFWAQQPDSEEDDVHIYVRPTNAGGLGAVKKYIIDGLGASAATVWVPVKCFVECALSALTFGIAGDCKKCLDDAIQQAKTAAHDAVAEIDGLAPGFGDHTSAAVYGGMPHHLNLAPGGLSSIWATQKQYDDRSGMLTERAGPLAVPDQIESTAMLVADGLGMTVHYETSLSPKRYEIVSGGDFHQDSTSRDEEDWELFNWPHTPFTPADNLGMFGWRQFGRTPNGWKPTDDDPQWNAKYLGWPLHGIGEAVSPMHLAGTFGYGHRPYEDATERDRGLLLYYSDREAARQQARSILTRALRWRQLVLDWRAQHPERGTDVPVRDLITALGQRTFQKVQGPTMLAWPFTPGMSTAYLADFGASIEYYRNPIHRPANRDILEEGIAATLAFLTSVAEAQQ
jgi:hypothetical protein